jgi:hypothetical protein
MTITRLLGVAIAAGLLLATRGTSAHPFGPGINFPYPDCPYGDPSRW